MASILEALSQGLRGAGAVYSPSVYNTQAQELENERNRSQRNKELVLGLLANAVEKGVMSPEAFQQRTQEMGLGRLPLGPSAQTQELMRQQGIRDSRGPAMRNIFGRGNSPSQVPDGVETKPMSQTVFSDQPQTDITAPTIQFEGEKYDPRLDPAAWRSYAQDREMAQDMEEATRAYAMADRLEKQGEPQLITAGGQIFQARPTMEEGSLSGYTVTPLTDKEDTGEAGARAKQAAMIRELMIRNGASPQEAQDTGDKVASGSWVRETDPQTGVTRIIDLSSPGGPRLVREFSSVSSPETPSTTSTPTDIRPGEAVGAGGVFKNVGNAVADFVGLDIPFPQTEAATNALQNLRINTLSVMQAAGSWRPSVFTSKLLDEVAQKPLQFFRGEARSRDRMESTRRMIQQEVESIDKALKSGNLRPNAVSDYTQKKIQLQQLELEYRTVVNAFDKSKKGKSLNIEDYWE